MKYRIIEVMTRNEVYYLLQIKRWFIWRTVQTTEYHPTEGPFKNPMEFNSKNGAWEHYRNYYMESNNKIVEEG